MSLRSSIQEILNNPRIYPCLHSDPLFPRNECAWWSRTVCVYFASLRSSHMKNKSCVSSFVDMGFGHATKQLCARDDDPYILLCGS